MPVWAIVIRCVAVVSIRIVATMTIVVIIGMMAVDPNVIVDPYVFTVINIDVDVVIPTPDIGVVSRIFYRLVPTSVGISAAFWSNGVA